MPKTLAQILRAAREEAELSQAALAKQVGLAPNHIARLESGGKIAPRFDTVARLAVTLGLSLDDVAHKCGYWTSAAGSRADIAALVRATTRLRHFKEAALEAGVAADQALNAIEGAVGRAPGGVALKKASKRR